VLIEAKDDGGGGDSWSDKSCKAPVKSPPPTNHIQFFYRPDALSVARTSVGSLKGNSKMFHGLAHLLTWVFQT